MRVKTQQEEVLPDGCVEPLHYTTTVCIEVHEHYTQHTAHSKTSALCPKIAQHHLGNQHAPVMKLPIAALQHVLKVYSVGPHQCGHAVECVS